MKGQKNFLKRFLADETRLRAYFIAVTGTASDADDLLQETAVVLWRKYEQYDQSREFLPWALGVARLEAMKWRQRKARSKLVFSEEAMSLLSETAERMEKTPDERLPALRNCLERLPPDSLSTLLLRYEKGESLENMALKLSKTIGAVMTKLSRIRDILRRCMEKSMMGNEEM